MGCSRLLATVLGAAAVAAGLLGPSSAVAATPPITFEGHCDIAGPIKPTPPITVVPIPNPHFSYQGTGACNGTLGGEQVNAAPATITFKDVVTSFDTCELGPDFDLHGVMVIGAGQSATRFDVVVDVARLALAGPLSLATAGGGQAIGTAQFTPAGDPTAAPQQCAGAGIGDASLAASFDTIAPLVGARDAPSAGGGQTAPPISTPPAAPSDPAPCPNARRLVVRLHAASGQRIVRADVYIDRRRVQHLRGRRLKRLTLPQLSTQDRTVTIVTRSDRGVKRTIVRRYAACQRSKR